LPPPVTKNNKARCPGSGL